MAASVAQVDLSEQGPGLPRALDNRAVTPHWLPSRATIPRAMAARAPSELASEIRAKGGGWTLSLARLRPPGSAGRGGFGASIAIGGDDVWAEIAIDHAGAGAAAAAAPPLAEAGYEILRVRSRPFHARRVLYGWREVDAEVRRLEMLAGDSSMVRTMPARRARPAGLPAGAGPFAATIFDRLQNDRGWWLEWISVCRKGPPALVDVPGWRCGAWCLALDDGEERTIDMHVQVFQGPARRGVTPENDAHGLDLAVRAFRAGLAPLRYRAVKLRGPKKPQFAVFEKSLPTLAASRRERAKLDRVLFGD